MNGARSTRHLRLSGWLVTAATLLALGGGAAGFPVYVEPQLDPVHRADAIFVLGGPGSGRYERGVELAEKGFAPELVLSDPTGDPESRAASICDGQFAFEVHCFDPAPATTAGEAQELGRRARSEGWNSVIVVTFTPHVSRARYILEHCYHGELTMVSSPDEPSGTGWARQYAYQTAGYVRAALNPAC